MFSNRPRFETDFRDDIWEYLVICIVALVVSELTLFSGFGLAGIVAAFLGSFMGSRLMKELTIKSIQLIVGVMLIFFGLAPGAGLI